MQKDSKRREFLQNSLKLSSVLAAASFFRGEFALCQCDKCGAGFEKHKFAK